MPFEYGQQFFRIHGLNVSVSTNSRWIARETRRDLKHYTASEPLRGQADANLNFFVGDVIRPSLHVPSGAVREVFANDIQVFSRSSKRYISLSSGAFIKLDLEKIRVEGCFPRNCEKSPMSRALLKWSIIKAFEMKSVFSIHCSGISNGGKVRLFVGRTGSGKTSILVLFLLNRHRMLADDVMFFQRRNLYPFSIRSTLHRVTLEKLRRTSRSKSLQRTTTVPSLEDLTRTFDAQLDKFEPDIISLYYMRVWNSNRTKLLRVSPEKMLGFLIDSYLAEFDNSYWFGWKRSEVVRKIMEAYTPLVQDARCFEAYAGYNEYNCYRRLVMGK